MITKPIVAIVDDESFIREILTDFLSHKYEVIAFESGVEFLNKISKFDVSAIIIDWKMPILSGIETLHELKRRGLCKNVPIAMQTGLEWSDENLKLACDAGVSVFLNKGSSWIYNIYHIDSLVKLFESQKKLDEISTLVINSLQHNINGWLTGIITIGSMLPMYPEWGDGPMFEKIKHMIGSSAQLHKVNEDLSTLLTNQKPKRLEKFLLELAVQNATKDLAYLKADIQIFANSQNKQCCACENHIIRLIYYMVLYFLKSIEKPSTIFISTGVENDQLYVKVAVKNEAVPISEALLHPHAGTEIYGTTFLAAIYIRKISESYQTNIQTGSSMEESYIKFFLPTV